jgi:hypothetical protein
LTAIGVTGHQDIPRAARQLVRETVRNIVEALEPPRGLLTSLAAGADQLVAREVLAAGGELHVIIPCAGYAATFGDAAVLQDFQSLVGEATDTEILAFTAPSEEAFWAAGKLVVYRCDVLLAIWDGTPARGLGGTGDVVRYAREQGRETCVIWPDSLRR